jgi:hypothetical protein
MSGEPASIVVEHQPSSQLKALAKSMIDDDEFEACFELADVDLYILSRACLQNAACRG